MISLTFRPIDVWNRPETDPRAYSPFRASYSDTLEVLRREIDQIGGDSAVILLDVAEREVRRDGALRADVKVRSPRVIVALDSRYGPLKYYCDRYTKWEANLRAIAFGMEALRRVERYGIGSRGEQYRGYTAIGAGIALGPHDLTPQEAAELLVKTAGPEWYGTGDDPDVEDPVADAVSMLLEHVGDNLDRVFKFAARHAHPDHGGNEEAFKDVNAARDLLAKLI